MNLQPFTSKISTQDSLLLRWVDDFLFITPSISKLNIFRSALMQACNKYSLQINDNKWNFRLYSANSSSDNDENFKWCSYCINSSDLSLKLSSTVMNDAFTIFHKTPFKSLNSSLCAFVRNRLKLINLCKENDLKYNVYQIYKYAALKLKIASTQLPKRNDFINKEFYEYLQYLFGNYETQKMNEEWSAINK
ncbi:hypothetical protein HZS_4301 [Henneguya salminicola]|nr:hypothetical protein HZS_4301 [Henneguya salminicola]